MDRVLQIVTDMNRGGLETMLMNYYRKIDRDKIQFDFLVHRKEKSAYDEEIKQLGGHIFHVPRLNPLNPLYYKALNSFFSEHFYKIVHSHLDCMSAYPLRAAKNAGVPIRIAHGHNANQDKNWKYLCKSFSKKLIPFYATELMACGREAGNFMFGRGKKYLILPNAIAVEQYVFDENVRKQIRDEFDLQDEFVLGHVGRFSPQKNHLFLLDVFEQVNRKNPKTKLMLVGGGVNEQTIKKEVEKKGLSTKVIFTGIRSDVYRLMQAMDVFVFPSLYEGLPVTLIEAQAAGLPCIISSKVPKECIVTNGLISIKELDDKINTWSDEIFRKKDIKRTDHSDEIRAHGFDIMESAKKLENYYIHCINNVYKKCEEE